MSSETGDDVIFALDGRLRGRSADTRWAPGTLTLPRLLAAAEAYAGHLARAAALIERCGGTAESGSAAGGRCRFLYNFRGS